MEVDLVDDLLNQGAVLAQGVLLDIEAVLLDHPDPQPLSLLQTGQGLDLDGKAGRDLVDVIGVDTGLLDGLAQQAVEDDGKVFEVPQQAVKPRRHLEPPEALIGSQCRGGIPLHHRLQHPVFGGVALGHQLGGQFLGKRRVAEALQAGAEVQRHKLPPLLGFQLSLGIDQGDHPEQGGLDGVVVDLPDPVVVFLDDVLGLFVQIGLAPGDGFLGPGPLRPGADAVEGVFFVRGEKQRKPQLKHPPGKHQGPGRDLVEQHIPKGLPVKRRVQRPAQPIVKVFDPFKGRRHFGQAQILGAGQFLQHAADLHFQANHLLFPFRSFPFFSAHPMAHVPTTVF